MDQQGEPAGSRITLVFPGLCSRVSHRRRSSSCWPRSFRSMSSRPSRPYTDTLPDALKQAILNHKVLVGMNTDMVMFAKGQPTSKSREMEGQMPFEEWIFGTPPEEVDFVRINGNRVIRVEIARDGQPLAIFTKDVVSPMLMAAGSPELADTKIHIIKEGDVETDPNKQEAAPPPSLRNPGETLPTDNTSVGVMRPVQFPKPHDNTPGADPDEQSSTPPATAPPASAPPSATTEQPAPSSTAPPAPAKQQPPAGSNQLVSTRTTSAVTN